jgi:ubiquinone/menaquinone biosynthesis C-methylase UbiE
MTSLMNNATGLSPAQWEEIEREEHDKVYAGLDPFDGTSVIDPARVMVWEDYCYKAGARPDRGHRTRRLLELIDIENLAGKRVLDVGCGIGQYSVFFAMKGADVTAFDISPVGIERGRQIAKINGVEDRCRFEVANASQMPYADGEFDIVVYHEVLHHAIKYPNVREETLRVLKPGGKVVISETLRGNKLLSMARRVSMAGEEAKGDVILELEDLRGFADGFSAYRIEPMSLFFMLKRAFRSYTRNPAVRLLLWSIKKTDDALLAAFPSMRHFCGECVMVMRK